MEDTVRIQKAKCKLRLLYPNVVFEFIGSGNESVVFTDNIFIYKFFDNELNNNLLLTQLLGRFKGCKRLFNLKELIEIDGFYVLKYAYYASRPYVGGRKEEIIEFLVECWERRIVHWDVKPLNFHVFNDGLHLIDYGYDIKPFNYKDFLFMVQRAYLMLNYPNNENFKALVRRALNNWDMEELNGFTGFFNEVYTKILSYDNENSNISSLLMFDDKILYEQVKQMCSHYHSINKILFYSTGEKDISCLFPGKDVLCITDISQLKESEEFDLAILDIAGKINSSELMHRMLKTIGGKMNSDCECAIIADNPFFQHGNEKYPLERLKNLILSASFTLKKTQDTRWQVDSTGDFYSQYLIAIAVAKKKAADNVSLLIKTCYQDGPFVERLIRHIISQLEGPDKFLEKIVVVDTKENNYLRQYSLPYKELTIESVEKLVEERVIDRFILVPHDTEIIKECNERWFEIKAEATHSVTNVPVFPQLYGFEQCIGDYILQVDSDAIIVRRDRDHSFLEDMKRALEENPNALSVSFNIAHSLNERKKEYTSPGNGHFVPEVRFCLLHRKRFFEQRPYPNELKDNHLKLTWYRSVEKAQSERGFVSLRGGDTRTFYIHPPNEIKKDAEKWFFIVTQAELNHIPHIQYENVDLIYDFDKWNIPKRNEKFVFVICGRNVSPSKFLRCWQSVLGQNQTDWGAIIVDDASENCLFEFISFLTAGHRDKVTLIHNRERKGVLENINNSIRHFCSNPDSVMIILDSDDMLLSKDLLLDLNRHYVKGADMTVGTAWRSEKGIIPYIPDFKNPRNKRGGDVWMHLRTFRKHLFDRIDENDFKKDGHWIDKFTELTYMIPIAEMAQNPVHIKFPVYFWQPSHIRNEEHYLKNRDTLQFMLTKKAYSGNKTENLAILKPFSELLQESHQGNEIIFIRHAETKESDTSLDGQYPDDLPLRENGLLHNTLCGKNSSIAIDLILISPTLRTFQTAKKIQEFNLSPCEIMELSVLRKVTIKDYDTWIILKERFGRVNLIEKWFNGEIPESVVLPYPEVAYLLLTEILERIEKGKSKRSLIVTHDHMIRFLSPLLLSAIPSKIRFLDGFVTEKRTLQERLTTLSKQIVINCENQN